MTARAPAGLRRSAPLLFLAALVLLADQFTKSLVIDRVGEGFTWDPPAPLDRLFTVQVVTNTGAAFGMLPNASLLFAVIAAVVAGAIVVYSYRVPSGQVLVRLGLALQLGGALGNLLDRLRLGYVVDFVNLGFWPFHDHGIFNVADASIVLGVGLLALAMLHEPGQPEERPDSSTPTSPPREEGEVLGQEPSRVGPDER